MNRPIDEKLSGARLDPALEAPRIPCYNVTYYICQERSYMKLLQRIQNAKTKQVELQ